MPTQSVIIQGGTSERPETKNRKKYSWVNWTPCLVEAVCVVHRSESAHKACQAVASAEKKKSVNVVSASAESEKISPEIWVLKELILGMNETIRKLKQKAETTAP